MSRVPAAVKGRTLDVAVSSQYFSLLFIGQIRRISQSSSHEQISDTVMVADRPPKLSRNIMLLLGNSRRKI